VKLLITIIDRWWDRRFHPMARVGLYRAVQGWRRGRSPEMAFGLGMLLVGMSRRGARRRLYVTDLVAGENVGIRVIERGEVVSETVIPAPGP